MSAWAYKAGANGTAVIPAGCVLTHLWCESRNAAATVVIFGGETIPVDGTAQQEMSIQFPVSQDPSRPGEILGPQSVAGATDIVFTNTVSYFVGYIRR